MCANVWVPIGRWCLEEGSAVGGSDGADVFLAVGGLCGFVLEWFGVHANWMYYAKGVIMVGCGSELRWVVIG